MSSTGSHSSHHDSHGSTEHTAGSRKSAQSFSNVSASDADAVASLSPSNVVSRWDGCGAGLHQMNEMRIADSPRSPTELNMLTVSFPISPEQRQQVSERTFRYSRLSSITDQPSRLERRRTSYQQGVLLNSQLSSSNASSVFQKSVGAGSASETPQQQQVPHQQPQQRQKTVDSIYDVVSNADCNGTHNRIWFI